MADDSLESLGRAELIERCVLAEENMKQAATFGNSLLSQLGGVRKERDKLQNELSVLEQSVHGLRGQLDIKTAMEVNCREELEMMQKDLAVAQKDIASVREDNRRLEQQSKCAVHTEMLKAEAAAVELAKVREEANAAILAAQNEANDLHAQLESATICGDSFNASKAACELAEAREEKVVLEQELASATRCERALKEELQRRAVELEEAGEVLRAREEKIACLKEQIETLQGQNAAMSADLEVARAGSAGSGARGNSLFSELEDRRVRAENCLVSQQERHRQLEQRYLAKLREMQTFKDEVGARLSALRHQNRTGAAEERARELEGRVTELEGELVRLRTEEERSAASRELELRQQIELAQAFEPEGEAADPSVGLYEALLRGQKQKTEEMTRGMERLEAEVARLRCLRKDALMRSARVEEELRETEDARVKLQFQMEGLREELNFLRAKEASSKQSLSPLAAATAARRNSAAACATLPAKSRGPTPSATPSATPALPAAPPAASEPPRLVLRTVNVERLGGGTKGEPGAKAGGAVLERAKVESKEQLVPQAAPGGSRGAAGEEDVNCKQM